MQNRSDNIVMYEYATQYKLLISEEMRGGNFPWILKDSLSAPSGTMLEPI